MRRAVVLMLALACSRDPEPPRCTAGGDTEGVVVLDGTAFAPPGWTTVEIDFEHPLACFELVPDKFLGVTLDDAGRAVATWAEDLPALALDHPAVGSRLTVAVQGWHWQYGVRWGVGDASLRSSFLPEELGGAMRLVPPTREEGMRP